MIKKNRFGNRTVSQYNRVDFDCEANAQEKFKKFARNYRSSLDQFVGQDGGQASPLSWGERRRIMAVLRKATMVSGPGQKSRIGRLGGGAAIGAVLAGFAMPAMAQYQAGGATANDSLSTAVGSGAVAGQAGVQTVDTNGDGLADLTLNEDSAFGTGATATGGFATAIGNGVSALGLYATSIGSDSTSTGNGAIAIGRTNTVDSFGVGSIMVQQGVLNRVTGAGNQTLGNGAADVIAAGIGIGTNNSVDGAGVAVGSGNLVNNTGSSGFAFGNANAPTGAYSIGIGMGNTASATSAIAIGTVSVASGNTAIAMGRQSTAIGQTSIALGNIASAGQTNAIAVGHSAQASASGTIAIGGGTGSASTNLDATAAEASAANAVAIGTNAEAVGASSLALGNASRGTGINGSAFGASAQANADNSTALGSSSVANGISATAIGHSNTAGGNFSTAIGMGSSTAVAATNSFAAGRTANAGGTSSVAIGHDVVASAADTVAIGHSSSAVGPGSVSIGLGQTSTGEGAVAIGDPNIANGQGALAIGRNNTAGGNLAGTTAASGAVALGNTNRAIGQGAVAIGRTSDALAAGAVAIGDTAVAGQAGAVALGSGSVTAAAHVGTFTINGGTVAAPSSPTTRTVSVGAAGSERQIQNVAAGVVSATSTDAINGSQLHLTELATNNLGESIETLVGGGLDLDVNGTIITNPSISVGATNYANITDAIQAGDDKADVLGADTASVLGGGAIFSAATGDISAPAYTVAGGNQANVGAALDALDDANALANTGLAAAIGGGAAVAADGTVTAPSVTVGTANYSNLTDAIQAAGAGFNLTTAAAGTGTATGTTVEGIAVGESVTLTAGDNIEVTQTGNDIELALNPALTGITSLDVSGGPSLSATGIAMNGDGITGLAPGSSTAGSTDAVNGGQLNTGLASVATNLGGGSTYDPGTGTVTAPSYALSGTTYTSVGDALAAIDSGQAGLVQQVGGAPGTGSLTVGAATGGTVVDFTGTDGARNLTGLLAGSTSSTSTDAVNGAQINTLSSSIATNTGGGSIYDPVTGTVTAPSYTVAGGTQTNTGAALDALDDAKTLSNTGISSAIGGGMAIAANGTVTAPTITVGTTSYANVTDAIEAAGAGFSLTTAATGTGVANGASVEGVAAGETVTLTAGNNIITTQNGNESQIALNPALTGITSLSVTGGPTIDATGINMNGDKITGLAAGATTAGSTEAVNGGQINTGLSSVATNLGGGATYDPVTGLVTAPGYAIDGTTFNTVGDALAALAADNKYVDFNSTSAAASASGTNASALGPNAQAAGNNAAALGVNSDANGTNSLALGSGAVSTGNNSVALGSGSQAGINNAGWTGTTIAGVTMTNAQNANAVVSVSGGTTNRQITGVADGAVNATSTDAINGAQLFNTASALDTKASNLGSGLSDALGGGAAVAADGTVTAPAYALSGTNYTNVGDALAAIDSGEVGLVKQIGGAPGSGDLTLGAGTGGTTVNFAGTAGDRVLSGVAAGSTSSTSTDAVNGSQLNLQAASVAAHLGGGATFNPATGVVTTPNYVIAGTTYHDVGSALGSLASGGAKQKYFNANSTLVDSTAVGVDSVAIGPNAVATNAGDVALGNGAMSAAPNSGAFTLNGGTVAAIAPTSVLSIGATEAERQIQHVAAGVVSASSTDAINGSQLFTVATAANNLGDSLETVTGGGLTLNSDGTIATPAAISVGGVTYANTTDAIEAGDAKADLANAGLVDALGGGAAAGPDGTVTAPVYTLGGTQYNNVGAALTALDSGATGIVRQVGGAPGTGQITVGAQTGGTSVSFTGTDGDRVLTGVDAGSLTVTSTDAVNGGQVSTLGNSIATNAGSESTFDPVTGTVTAPSYSVAGGTQTNTGAALDALDDANSLANNGLASAIGGGAAVGADGNVTAPTIDVNGTNFSNLTDAIEAAGAGYVLTTGATGSGVANGASMATIGAGETVTLTAGNNIVATQVGNEVQVALNADVTGLNSVTATTVNADALNITGGPVIDGTGIALAAGDKLDVAGNKITNLAAGSTAPGSSDAINGGQLNTALASVAANTGGGSTYDPVTGTVTAPSISVGGTGFATVSDAIEAADDKMDAGLSDTAAALGGGAVYDPLTGDITNPTYGVQGASFSNVGDAFAAIDDEVTNLSNGTSGLVQQVGGAPGAGQITVGAATGGTSLSVAGTDGNRTVTGVAAGSLGATSTDAVNGSQINTALGSVASGIGGGSVVDPLTGTVTAPAINVGGVTYANATDAIEAGDAKANQTNAGLAAALGGGAAVAPDGTVTAPSYTVQGSTYTNVGDAIAGVDGEVGDLKSGAAGLLQFSDGGAGRTSPNGGTASQNMTLAGAGAGMPVQLSNLAGGEVSATSSDAVNGAQLFALGNALGGGSTFGPNGTVIPPSYSINGDTYTNAGDAFGAINGAITGGGIKYFHANSTQADSAPVGSDSIAIGPVSGAAGDRSISIGMNANASGTQSIAIGVGNVVSGTNSGAIGDPNTVTGNESYAFGNNNTIAANNAYAVGNGITIAAGNDGSVGLGNGTTVSAPNAGAKSLNGGSIAATSPTSVVSVGAAGAERQVTNVAAGVVSATSTDAINGSQLFAIGSAVNRQGTGLAAALGGGAAVAPDGTVTAPSYTVQGSSVNNVGAALSSLDGAVSGLTSGTAGLVQQSGGSPGTGAVTVAAATGGTVVNVAGTDGNRVVTGVADGSLAAGSTDAVNGGQLTATTAAGAAKSDAIGASVAANLGGGSAYNPATGTVSAPSYSVGGQSYGTVGAAVAATNLLAVQYVADSAGAPTNVVRLTGNGSGQPVAIANVANGAIAAGSTDAVNGGQLHGVQQTANGALQRTGGTLSGNLALGGNRVTGLAGPVDTADAATKGYVDTLQGQTNVQLQSLTSGLNGAFNRIERNSQGVALAIAMGGGFLSDDKKFSLWGAWGNFDGYNALAAQTYIRLSDDVILNGGLSFGLEENLVGTRVGFGIQF